MLIKVPRAIEVAKRLSVRQTPRRYRHHWFAQNDDDNINQIDDELFVSRQRLAIRQLTYFICYDKVRVPTFLYTSLNKKTFGLRAVLRGGLQPAHPRHTLELPWRVRTPFVKNLTCLRNLPRALRFSVTFAN